MPPKEGAEHGWYQHGKNQHNQACSDGLSRAGTAPHTPTPSLGESLGYVTPGHSLSLCVSQREDEIEAIISISDGLNLVSAHLSQPSGSMQLPGPEHSSLLQSPGGGGVLLANPHQRAHRRGLQWVRPVGKGGKRETEESMTHQLHC